MLGMHAGMRSCRSGSRPPTLVAVVCGPDVDGHLLLRWLLVPLPMANREVVVAVLVASASAAAVVLDVVVVGELAHACGATVVVCRHGMIADPG